MSYAAKTTVSCERSRAEIETILNKYGATGFMSGWEGSKGLVAFQINERHVKFILPIPHKEDKQFKLDGRGSPRSKDQILKAWEQACRQKWRALLLCIKAKLEACEAGITTFDEEFMAHLVLPSGETVGQFIQPQIDHAYKTGEMPKLLTG